MIGGEFPIAISDILKIANQQYSLPGVYCFSSGRAALYQILKFLMMEKGVSHVFLPDYLCSSVLVPINALGLEFSFYPLDEKLKTNIASFRRNYHRTSATLLINYFGLQDLTEQIRDIRSIDNDAIIIEDDVQAYYEFKKPLNGADFKFTSLRKTFGVPDGGLVKTSFSLPKVSIPNTFGQYKVAGSILKSIRNDDLDDQIYLELFDKGESMIDNEMELGMSPIAKKLTNTIDEVDVKIKRQRNSQYIFEQLKEIGIKPLLPLLEGHTPLFIPILLKNRDTVRKRMFQRNIFCPVHWPLEGMEVKMGKVMSENELSLIIDQRYGIEDMNKIINILKNAK